MHPPTSPHQQITAHIETRFTAEHAHMERLESVAMKIANPR
jgi:hypothetical protein